MFAYLHIIRIIHIIHTFIHTYTYHTYNILHIMRNRYIYTYTFHISLTWSWLKTLIVHTICCYKQFAPAFSISTGVASVRKDRTDIKRWAIPFDYQFHQRCFTLVKYCRRWIATTPSKCKQLTIWQACVNSWQDYKHV